MATQLAEKLFQVGQRNLLALADRGQGNRAGVGTQAQVDHGGDGEAAFGGESHEVLLARMAL
jgi:hypothetical protein